MSASWGGLTGDGGREGGGKDLLLGIQRERAGTTSIGLGQIY